MKYLVELSVSYREMKFVFDDFEEATIFVLSAIRHGNKNIVANISVFNEEVEDGREE